MNALCQTVMQFLEAGTPLVLATMMDQKGSVPRAAGAWMLILPDGTIHGTVGGGRYEAEAITVALSLHQAAAGVDRNSGLRPGAVLEYSLRGVTDMDMICGGTLTMLLEFLHPRHSVGEAFRLGREAEESGQAFVMLSSFTRTPEESVAESTADSEQAVSNGSGKQWKAQVERFALACSGAVTGTALIPEGAKFPEEVLRGAAALTGSTPHHLEFNGREYLLELYPRPYRIMLFGGGHVSREVAELADRVDFHTTVIDDRPEFSSPERFPQSQVVTAPTLEEDDCAALLTLLDIRSTDGIVIVTRGHSHDRDALAAAVNTKAGYIGMIGSKSKRAAIYAALRKNGVSEERIASVHSPIGLAIGAQTPAEIAVSIVGELIEWRKSARDADDKRNPAV